MDRTAMPSPSPSSRENQIRFYDFQRPILEERNPPYRVRMYARRIADGGGGGGGGERRRIGRRRPKIDITIVHHPRKPEGRERRRRRWRRKELPVFRISFPPPPTKRSGLTKLEFRSN